VKLQCPTCGESADAAHYPVPAGTPRYCWECIKHGRGRVEVLEVIFLHARPKLPKDDKSTTPEPPAEPIKSAKPTAKKKSRRTA